MNSFFKKVFCISAIFNISALIFAAEPKTPEQALDEMMALESFDEDFDAMFEDAQDTEAVKTEEPQGPAKTNDGTYPLKLSGHLDSDFGLGYIYQKEETNKPNGYFTFNNYIYMNARPTPDTTVKGTLGITFPGYALGLNECYFDYIIKNKIYFTAGKKATTWGYPRLLTVSSNATRDKQSDFDKIGAQNTNILFDSGNGTSFMFRVPVLTGTVSGIALYSGSSTQPSFDDMKFAGSVEMVIVKTSVNIFGRGGKNEINTKGVKVGPLLGLEAKRTILGADVYGQGLCRFDTNDKFLKIFNGNNFNAATFQQLTFTGGLYKWWDAKDPAVGFNIEYQGTCNIISAGYESEGKEIVHRVAFDGGVKRLGKNHNIKLGIELNHNFTDKSGYIKPGVIISGALPNCDWNNGFKWYYGKYEGKTLARSGRWEIGSYFTLALNY